MQNPREKRDRTVRPTPYRLSSRSSTSHPLGVLISTTAVLMTLCPSPPTFTAGSSGQVMQVHNHPLHSSMLPPPQMMSVAMPTAPITSVVPFTSLQLTPAQSAAKPGEDTDDDTDDDMEVGVPDELNSPILNASPNLDDLYELTKSQSDKWDDIGRRLKISLDFRKSLRESDSSAENKLEEVLNNWIESRRTPVTWSYLIEILQRMKLNNVTKEIEDFLKTPQAVETYGRY